MKKKILIVGAGFSGAVMARELAVTNNFEVLVVDERNHIAGNCYTARDGQTNIMEHVYGPHIFNTNNEVVWKYIQNFGEFIPYTNRVKAVTAKGIFSLPINLLTINQFFKTALNPSQAAAFMSAQGDSTIVDPQNFEEQALRLMGKDCYENFFKGYTIKQWGCDPKELPASILNRLPVRYSYDDNYYNSRFQGIPIDGYTAVVSNLLNHPQIKLKLNHKYTSEMNSHFDHVFYSGPLDAYFDFKLGRLGYRTIYFEKELHDGPDFQGNPVINYCEETVLYTRVHEHKHFTPWESHEQSIYFKEYSKETGPTDIPYYPKRLNTDKILLKKYRELAEGEKNVTFIGRLGTYRYMDMHHVIDEALKISSLFAAEAGSSDTFLKFFNTEDS
ncbi:UDP-galactopyranose mutase [Pedobacter namyangjuensis]|uniref:UDP-galactopyranose mutase n=1 Tax=Pedobacter namyangjuensis TaxID=600626 RepID=UPI000DE4E0C1|nr:UDP-galactopyranose mutase [Pedobacter namyangjuensis]